MRAQNKLNINDWSSVQSLFDKLNKQMEKTQKASESLGTPRVYIKMLVELEVTTPFPTFPPPTTLVCRVIVSHCEFWKGVKGLVRSMWLQASYETLLAYVPISHGRCCYGEQTLLLVCLVLESVGSVTTQ